MSYCSRRRVVREPDVNHCLVVAVRPELNDSVLLDCRTRRALPGDQPVGFQPSKIEKALRRSAEMDASRIKVDANGGTVTLSGNVRSWAEMKRAESAAWGAPGVRNVLNRIEIVS